MDFLNHGALVFPLIPVGLNKLLNRPSCCPWVERCLYWWRYHSLEWSHRYDVTIMKAIKIDLSAILFNFDFGFDSYWPSKKTNPFRSTSIHFSHAILFPKDMDQQPIGIINNWIVSHVTQRKITVSALFIGMTRGKKKLKNHTKMENRIYNTSMA